jgi:hypothetical protein
VWVSKAPPKKLTAVARQDPVFPMDKLFWLCCITQEHTTIWGRMDTRRSVHSATRLASSPPYPTYAEPDIATITLRRRSLTTAETGTGADGRWRWRWRNTRRQNMYTQIYICRVSGKHDSLNESRPSHVAPSTDKST